ncbi:uncharacterized protein FIESC28_02349 [Fusarium coffeatum]|uniref:RelA/SpoT domain-containing protein n=1 Tax=Fusarium coffeatum TaxID=231269 RepID=A0A366S6E1_9HYPO|nr:uncharacterized protein FIESC28_02349 [Fusarium coffeatum]RBR24859.1 hypothetical protein FIESC28_02349 [Fusarium coffeatum]
MAQQERSQLESLSGKVDAALQNVPAGRPPEAAFLEIWQVVQPDYESMRLDVHRFLSRLVDEKHVQATVASRTKTLESISKSIDRRNDAKLEKQKYQSPREIFADLHDLVGLRVVVDYPRGLDQYFHLIEESFQVDRFNAFSSERTISQHWIPRFGAYETRNYLLRLNSSEEFALYAGVLFEIQITTMAESLYNKLSHSLLYKAPQGGLSRKDEMVIDMGHGAALLYWITIACMEDRLEGNFEEMDPRSRFPPSVRDLAGCEDTVMNLDALVDSTPLLPSTSNHVTSRDYLLESFEDIRRSSISGESIAESIREKLG